MNAASYMSLDNALGVLAGCGIALKNGNSNHAPMVAEALCATGRPDAVMPWVARYRDNILPRPASGRPVSPDDWRKALGQRDRFADWADFFCKELQEDAWPRVLDRWVARLAPGFSAAATHGVIRVGHAVRALCNGETAPRLRELGDALASWAASYSDLPAGVHSSDGTMPPREAITQVPIIAPEDRPPGNITSSLAVLSDCPEFGPAIGLIDVSGQLDRLLAELAEVFAWVFLANARDRLTAIVFIHGVTSLSAAGNIMPSVSENTARTMLRYGWQSGCALYACFGSGMAMAQQIDPRHLDEHMLLDRALANGDEHVIKFTEACLHRNALASSPAYLPAIDNALRLLAKS